jgi:hypothetical protein
MSIIQSGLELILNPLGTQTVAGRDNREDYE